MVNFRKYIRGFFFMLLAISLLYAQENYEVQEIQFIGNKSFSKETLLEHVAMHGISNLDKLVFKKNPFLYSEELLQSDL
jgi:hypothetical protein